MAQLENTNTTPSAAEIGYGSTFAVGVGDPADYTEVAEITSIKPSGITTGEEDVTNLRSPGGIREFIPTLGEGGTYDIGGTYIADTTQLNLEALAIARTIFPFQTKFAVGGKTQTRTGRGFFTKFAPGDLVVDKAPSFTATFRITGIVDVTTV